MNIEYCIKSESYKVKPEKAGFRFIPIDWRSREINLISGKRDWAAFQVVLKVDENYSINIGENPYFSEKTGLYNMRLAVVSEMPAELQLIGNVKDDDGFQKADILLHQETIEYGKDEPSSVWIEIPITEETLTKTFQGKVTIYGSRMFEKEELIGFLSFELKVLDYIMPRPDQYRFHLDLWQHNSNIARKHDVRLWSKEHFQVIKSYIQSLSELGQKAVTILASQVPWRGQSCFYEERTPSNLFEYSMISVIRRKDGSYFYDFSYMQQYIDLCFSYGIDKEIEIFGITSIWIDERNGYTSLAKDYPDAMKVRYYDEQAECFAYMNCAKDLIAYVQAIEGYFKDKELIDRVRLVTDEPQDHNDLRKSLDFLKKIVPSFQYKAAINCAELVQQFAEDISDFVPFLSCVSYEWEFLQKCMAKRKDKRFLWYVCCSPLYLNTFISNELLEGRFIGIFTSYIGFAGFLRWNYTVWGKDPRNDVRYSAFPAGDTNFVYPAYNGVVMKSLRYKALKRGIEDFELLERFREKYGAEKTDKLLELVIKQPDVSKYAIRDLHEKILPEDLLSLDSNDYDKLRFELLSSLSCSDIKKD